MSSPRKRHDFFLRIHPEISTQLELSSRGSPIKVTKDLRTGMQIRIGVMGSAADKLAAPVARVFQQLGRAIAESGSCLLTGACPGIPHQVVLGAKERGGHVIGISPAVHLK